MNWAIIVAAGKGSRMGGDVPKPYLPLEGMPVLGHTLTTFHWSGEFEELLLVVAAEEWDICRREVIAPLGLGSAVRLVAGGRERQESVFNGLEACSGHDDDPVLIHDGVRPLVRSALLTKCLAATRQHGACIAAIPSSDTLKQCRPDGCIAKTLDRDKLWRAQTPQGFRLGLIRAAHRQARQDGFGGTDDAQLLERIGQPVFVIPGQRTNIKLTHPGDLPLAAAIWRYLQR